MWLGSLESSKEKKLDKNHPQAHRPELKPEKHPETKQKSAPLATPAHGAFNPVMQPPSGNVGPAPGGQAPQPNPKNNSQSFGGKQMKGNSTSGENC